jgi:hypothetical protein
VCVTSDKLFHKPLQLLSKLGFCHFTTEPAAALS